MYFSLVAGKQYPPWVATVALIGNVSDLYAASGITICLKSKC
jgi:hypothetical protein